MGTHSVIRLQEKKLFVLDTAAVGPPVLPTMLEQPQSQAVNVAPFLYVTPFVRIYQSSDTYIPPAGAKGTTEVKFLFYSAAVLLDPQEGLVTGALLPSSPGTGLSVDGSSDRFLNLGAEILVTSSAVTYEGVKEKARTLTLSGTAPSNGGFASIFNPGGLMIWKCINSCHSLSKPVTF